MGGSTVLIVVIIKLNYIECGGGVLCPPQQSIDEIQNLRVQLDDINNTHRVMGDFNVPKLIGPCT